MPTITRSRSMAADPQEVWRVVSDPERLPAWWPGVQRVEEATGDTWTSVLSSPRGGRTVRADYTLVDAQALRSATWRHEVEESPFERILTESLTDVELEPEDAGTRVSLRARMRLRGLSRLGAFQVRRATARQLEEALEGLDYLVGERP